MITLARDVVTVGDFIMSVAKLMFFSAFVFAMSMANTSLAGVNQTKPPADLKYGPEWTFTVKKTGDLTEEELDLVLEKLPVLKKIFINHCRQTRLCTVTDLTFTDDIEVVFKNGMIIRIENDPGVIEIQAEPMSLKQIKKYSNFIQQNIFDVLSKAKLYPHEREGAGHINIDLNYFSDKPLLLYNFIIDFFNHPGLGIVLNSMTANKTDAPYFDQIESQLKSENDEPSADSRFTNYLAFKKILTQFTKQIQKNSRNLSTEEVLEMFNTLLHEKYIALGIRGLNSFNSIYGPLLPTSRLEVRVLRPQATAFDYQLVLEIFESRIQYLSQLTTPLVLKPIKPIHDGYIALGQYADYLEESGLNLERYKSLLPQAWRDLDSKNYIRRYIKGGSCNKLF